MTRQVLPRLLIPRLPFFYGWVVLGCVCCAGFARQGSAVATLSIFVQPMIDEFGWSRSALSGAVSLGGVLAAVASPILGPQLDRHGARLVLCLAVLLTAVTTMLLSSIGSLIAFYLLFCLARMSWAGPFELGIYGALNNWFVERRAFATSIATLAQMAGLVAMPLIAQLAILHDGWRAGWLAIGLTVLTAGFLPTWLLMLRRPEDVGLVPDRRPREAGTAAAPAGAGAGRAEPEFSRRQALRTPAFWLLSAFALFVYPVQAGVSLHQVAYLIERGLDATIAATVVSAFSLASGVAVLALGFLPRRLPIRHVLAALGTCLALGVLLMLTIASAVDAYLAAALFGLGIGGILTLLPVAWADYFGRRSFGAIRGVALTVQVLAQAAGPLLSGVLRDLTGSYELSLQCFAVLAGLGIVAALLARQPKAA